MEDKIEALLKNAESIVDRAGISSTLRPTAFGEVFRVLWQAESNETASPVGSKGPQPSGDQPRPILPTSTNPASLVQRLIDEDFFKQPRKDTDVQDRLRVLGFSIPRKRIATVLVRKVRDPRNSLKRDKSDKGYVYVVG